MISPSLPCTVTRPSLSTAHFSPFSRVTIPMNLNGIGGRGGGPVGTSGATGLPVSNVRSMADVVIRSTSRQRFNMWLMTIFGASALLLAAIGIHGLMAYSVEQRTQEIGIRLSLGADGASVRRMVVVQGMRLALVGVVVGLAASWGLARLMTSFLFDVTARDPLVFAGVPVVLTLVALLAVWLPAMRASKVDPMVALRYE